MATGARVQDIDVIRHFRANLIKFVESANTSLTDGEGDVTRKLGWLEGEQQQYWTSQIRKWTENVNRAKDAVRQKRIFKDAMGRVQSTIDEEKHLKKCQAVLNEAETKLAATRRHAKQLQREHLLYRGGVQRLATLLSSDLPNSIALLDRLVNQLEAYVQGGPTMTTSEAGPDGAVTTEATGAEGAMKRAVDEAQTKKDDADPAKAADETSADESSADDSSAEKSPAEKSSAEKSSAGAPESSSGAASPSPQPSAEDK